MASPLQPSEEPQLLQEAWAKKEKEKIIEKRTQTTKLLPKPSEQHQAPVGEGSWTVVAHLYSTLGMLNWGDTWSKADPWGLVLHPIPRAQRSCGVRVKHKKTKWGEG